MVPRVDQNLGSRTCCARHQQGHTPIGETGVIEDWRERLVFHKHQFIGSKPDIRGTQQFLKPLPFLAWVNFPKRVPVFAKPQEGMSMRNTSRAWNILSVSGDRIRFAEGTFPRRSKSRYFFPKGGVSHCTTPNLQKR